MRPAGLDLAGRLSTPPPEPACADGASMLTAAQALQRRQRMLPHWLKVPGVPVFVLLGWEGRHAWLVMQAAAGVCAAAAAARTAVEPDTTTAAVVLRGVLCTLVLASPFSGCS